MIVILISAAAILIAEAVAWAIGGRLRHRRAGLYDYLAVGDTPSQMDDNPPAQPQSNLIASTNRYADFWIVAPLVILVVAVVGYPLVPAAAIFARNINIFLQASFWISIILAIVAAVLLALGFLDFRSGGQTTQLRLAAFLALMAVIFAGLTWLVYSPPKAPVDYEQAFYALAAFPLDDINWTQLASNLLNKYQPPIEFLFLQTIGLPFMLMALVDVLYILGCSIYAHFTQRMVPVSVNLLILAPLLAGAASLCFGIL